METILQWLYDTPVATAIRESGTLFPMIESIHVLSITLVVGSISVVDLRLLGVTSKNRTISTLTSEVLPVTWTAFVVAAIAGSLLFSSNAVKYAHNIYFLIKMSLLIVALVNMLAFHFIISRDIEHWDHKPVTPIGARMTGAISLAVWIGVIICGRLIGFTMAAF
jgi:hypothetical protein